MIAGDLTVPAGIRPDHRQPCDRTHRVAGIHGMVAGPAINHGRHRSGVRMGRGELGSERARNLRRARSESRAMSVTTCS